MRALTSLMVCLFIALGCDRETPAPPPAPPPAAPPSQEELMQLVAQEVGPVPDLGIAIQPEVRAWETRDDRWAVEATVRLTNGGAAPIDLDVGRLRVRDQARPLQANVRGAEGRSRLAPGASVALEVTASHHPADSGQPTILLVDYGTVAGMTPAVSAPVTPVRTTGLVATFRDARAAERVHAAYVHGRGSPPRWQVRLAMDVHNPTDELVRMPYGQLTAVRENGTASYWGDHAGVSIDDRWFDPGERRTAAVTLMFEDSPSPPTRITLTYASGGPQRVELPDGP